MLYRFDLIAEDLKSRNWTVMDWVRKSEINNKTATRLLNGENVELATLHQAVSVFSNNIDRYFAGVSAQRSRTTI